MEIIVALDTDPELLRGKPGGGANQVKIKPYQFVDNRGRGVLDSS